MTIAIDNDCLKMYSHDNDPANDNDYSHGIIMIKTMKIVIVVFH